MAAAEFNQYDLVSLGPDATGSRATANGSVVPLIAWGVFHHTIRRQSDGSGVRDLGKIMAGVIANVHPVTPAGPAGSIADFQCAAALSKMDGYLSPHMPNPHV
jgi:hypothetical protein